MATKADREKAANEKYLRDLNLKNPASTPLPPGLKADPTYLAFLRGIGFTYNQAWAAALKQVGDTRAAYATTIQRLPEQLREGKLGVNNALGERGLWNSGERLTGLSKQATADQERHADANSQLATGLSGVQTSLQEQISQLARQQADAVGGLQDRRRQQENQDKYLAAVRGAAGGGGGGGGSYSVSIGAPPAAPAANGLPPMAPGQSFSEYYSSLNPAQQAQLSQFFSGFHDPSQVSTEQAGSRNPARGGGIQ